jgi:hypothetical protein
MPAENSILVSFKVELGMDPSAVSDVKSIPFTCAPDRKKAVTGSPAEREASSPVRLLVMKKIAYAGTRPPKQITR